MSIAPTNEVVAGYCRTIKHKIKRRKSIITIVCRIIFGISKGTFYSPQAGFLVSIAIGIPDWRSGEIKKVSQPGSP